MKIIIKLRLRINNDNNKNIYSKICTTDRIE